MWVECLERVGVCVGRMLVESEFVWVECLERVGVCVGRMLVESESLCG